MKTNSIRKTNILGVTTVALMIVAAGCKSSDFGSDPSSGTISSSAALANNKALASAISMSVYNSGGGAAIYSDSQGAGQTLQMTVGQNYVYEVDATNLAAGATATISFLDTDVIGATATSYSITPGVQKAIAAPSPGGDYLLTLQVNSGGNVAQKSYQAAIGCVNPNFTQASLIPTGISVTAGSATNLYNYSAAGVISNPANYLCGFDLAGTGILSTKYVTCDTPLTNVYVSDVGYRKVAVMVKDQCNNSLSVTAPGSGIDLAYNVPAMGTEVPYIYGVVSTTNINDPRVNGVTYLSTNNNVASPVQSNYGGGAFSITSEYSYSTMKNGQPSSVPFGMTLTLRGITGSVNLAAKSNNVSFTGMYLDAATFSTDQSADVSGQITLQSASGTNNCTATHLGGKVLNSPGTPCYPGTTGDNNAATVEVWGDYTCKMSGSYGTATVTGSFDGIYHMADSCIGGGGGGGGGVTPIAF
ncbi:MAG: hypothetical protein P4M08_06815 [Oligoflexia bacterium]|nr:hypothetical protein [Oligoflexia bacterium]